MENVFLQNTNVFNLLGHLQVVVVTFKYGLRSTVLAEFYLYLALRKQYVRVRSYQSSFAIGSLDQ